MKKKKIWMVLAITAVFCMGMTACGNNAEDEEEVVGGDWRTWGDVVDSGTITHDGVDVDVLVTVEPTSAAFYWDEEEQVLFDSVLFPEEIPDAKEAFTGIYFDDVTGDDETDVVVEMQHDDGAETLMIWFWDPEERYVYQWDISYIHAFE